MAGRSRLPPDVVANRQLRLDALHRRRLALGISNKWMALTMKINYYDLCQYERGGRAFGERIIELYDSALREYVTTFRRRAEEFGY